MFDDRWIRNTEYESENLKEYKISIIHFTDTTSDTSNCQSKTVSPAWGEQSLCPKTPKPNAQTLEKVLFWACVAGTGTCKHAANGCKLQLDTFQKQMWFWKDCRKQNVSSECKMSLTVPVITFLCKRVGSQDFIHWLVKSVCVSQVVSRRLNSLAKPNNQKNCPRFSPSGEGGWMATETWPVVACDACACAIQLANCCQFTMDAKLQLLQMLDADMTCYPAACW